MGRRPTKDVLGNQFNGPLISFGSLVEYHPITAKDQARIHQFGKKVIRGLFLGYALYAGRIWKGDVEGLYTTPHIYEQMTAQIMATDNMNLEHNTISTLTLACT